MSRYDQPGAAQVVVVGAGFGGLPAVRALRGSAAQATLVDRRPYSTFSRSCTSRDRRTGRRRRRIPDAPLRAPTAGRVPPGTLTKAGEDKITFDDGTVLAHDYLILSAGVTTNYFGVPGASEHSMALYTARKRSRLETG